MGKKRAKERSQGPLRASAQTLGVRPEPFGGVEPPRSISEVIRETLKALESPDAKAAEVKRVALERFPSWKDAIEGEKNWSAYVAQNRGKAADEMGIDRSARRGSPPPGTLAFEDYEAARKFVEGCGGVEQAEEILEFLATSNITTLRKAVKAWSDLVESVGSPGAALKALEAMKGTGGVVAR